MYRGNEEMDVFCHMGHMHFQTSNLIEDLFMPSVMYNFYGECLSHKGRLLFERGLL